MLASEKAETSAEGKAKEKVRLLELYSAEMMVLEREVPSGGPLVTAKARHSARVKAFLLA